MQNSDSDPNLPTNSLDYQSAPISQELNFIWQEDSDTLSVHFPAPSPERRSLGCAIAVLAITTFLGIPLPIILAWRLLNGMPTDTIVWVVSGVIVIICAFLLWSAIDSFREARLPAPTMTPTVLSVCNGILKIERAGRNRDMDYSWAFSEIADIRLCPAAPDRVFFSAHAWLVHMLHPEELIRISVLHPSGEVDDIMVSAPGRYWADPLEAKLRSYLGLSSPDTPHIPPSDEV